jgi:hypothetical protein
MDRREHKSDFDGMRGHEATPIEAFGFLWVEDTDGVTRFYLSDITPTATYGDGGPRAWQSRVGSFEWSTLKTGVVKKARPRC